MLTDGDVVVAMYTYGGSFVAALAQCWQRGDAVNRARLQAAFPDIWEQYREIAALQLHRDGQRHA